MEKPTVKLIGEDGNAFNILAKTRKALRKHLKEQGLSPDEIREEVEKFTKEATDGDYDHLLAVVMKWFEVE